MRLPQDAGLLLAAHDIDQGNAVLQADLVEHLAEIGRSCRVNQRLVTLAPHGLGHAERGQRIDEAGGAFRRRRAVGQHQAFIDPERNPSVSTATKINPKFLKIRVNS